MPSMGVPLQAVLMHRRLVFDSLNFRTLVIHQWKKHLT